MISALHSIYLLAFNSGLQSGFSKFGLSMWLRDSGADLMLLNLFSLTMFPSVFSVFWLPFLENVDVWRLKFGIKKNLIIFFDFIVFFMTICLKFFNIQNLNIITKSMLIFFLVLYASIISTRDSISIGYKIEFISRDKLHRYDGVISSFYQAGLLLSTAGLLKISELYSWDFIFFTMFVWFGINLIIDLCIENSSYNKQDSLTFVEKFSKPYSDLLVNNRGIISNLFLFLIFYNLAERMLAGNLNYYILDEGITKSVFANLKLLTSVLGIIIGVVTTYLTSKLGVKKMLIFSLILYSFIPITIFLNIYFKIFASYNKALLIFLYVLDKAIKVFQGTSFFTYQMQFCTKENASSQRALFVFLERGLCMAIAPIIGWSLTVYGYCFFFFIVSLSIIPSLFFLLNLLRVEKKSTRIDRFV